MSEVIKQIEKETVALLAGVLDGLDTPARNTEYEGQFGGHLVRALDRVSGEMAKETLKQLARKCICCGAPGYEVNH